MSTLQCVHAGFCCLNLEGHAINGTIGSNGSNHVRTRSGDLLRRSVQQPNNQTTKLAKTHYENFTVMSLLLPRKLRQDVANLYAYCRSVDDIGDEADGSRVELLNIWEDDLQRCFCGVPRHPVLKALQTTIQHHNLPIEPFLNLIEANRRDQLQHRYSHWEELLDYCRYSANPVGRLYLQLLGYTDTKRLELSDATCTALQLANFWQDISRDVRLGRIYIPQDELFTTGVCENDIITGHNSAASAALIDSLCDRTIIYFKLGLGLLDLLPPRHAYNVRLFSLGGMAILDAVRSQKGTALTERPVLQSKDKWRLALQAFLG